MADLILNKDNVESAELLYAHPEATDEERQRMELALSTYYANMFNMQSEDIQEKLRNLRSNQIANLGTIEPYTPSSDLGQIVGAIPGSIVGETRGARIGGTAGAVIGGVLGGPPGAVTGQRAGTIGGAIIGSAIGAYTGAAAGDITQQFASNYMNDRQFSASMQQALQAGGEEAMYDFLGQVAFRGIPGAYRTGKELFSKAVGKSPETDEVLNILNKQGTYASVDQMTDNVIITTMGQILRSLPITNRNFVELDTTQSQAFIDYFDNLAKTWAGHTIRDTTPVGFGRIVRSVLKGGDEVFDEAMRTQWKNFDDFIADKFINRKVTVEGYTPQAARTAYQEVVRIPPVNVKPIRDLAKNLLEEAYDIGAVDPNAHAVQLLKSISMGNNNLTFGQAHTLLSDLKRLQRSGRTEGLPSSIVVSDLIGELDSAFNKASDKFKDLGISETYENLRRQTRLGKNRFNADFVNALLGESDPTKIATLLNNATPAEINQMKKAVYYADSLAKRTPGSSWSKIQGGFLAQFFPTNIQNIASSPIMKIIDNGDQVLNTRLVNVVGQEQADKIIKSFSLLNKLKVKPIFGASLSQSLVATGGVVGGGYFGGWEGAVGAVLVPRVLTKIFTSPKLTNKFYSLMNQTQKATTFSPVNKANAFVRLARASYELARETEEMSVETQ